MNLLRIGLVLALLISPALGQNLVSLVPPGAVAGFTLGDLSQHPRLRGIAQDWAKSGLEAELRRAMREEAVDPELLGLLSRGAAAAFYPSGDFFVIAKPTPQALQSLRKGLRKPQNRGGWQVDTQDGMVTGLSRDLALVASSAAFERFIRNQRGLKAPVGGDLAFWAELPKGFANQLELPPRIGLTLSAVKRFTFSLKLTPQGISQETRLEFVPGVDPQLTAIALPKDQPWELGDFPQGVAASTGVVDIPALGRYLNALSRDLNSSLNLDLSAFGKRVAQVTFNAPTGQQGVRSDALAQLGDMLLFVEVLDPPTAEANLLGLLQNFAAFATPEGKGGFKVVGKEGDFKAVEVGLLGRLYYRFDADRLILATSKAALEGLSNPAWKENPRFQQSRQAIPARAVSYGFSDAAAQIPSIESLLQSTLLPAGSANQARRTRELSRRMGDFMVSVLKRFGDGINYATVEGNTLISRSLSNVRW
ncbi:MULTISPECIES: hypothetical protein [unclassified Meiothermus]|uniref:hypothetical protein n=1 Tax=unclassified Meiothermus TaxID=370471 RepID=UPI000D7C4DC8|nr:MULTISPECIES: hypothetical protein [unclassified Meiothermus]PZA07923.1 hypothetical protein DNA98_06395 [Meiothermus sp. Pnk-1]RYM36730.1 hypothetical protein EWH23_08810 [Meiothermus sp. PNK-Is4]